MLDGGCDDVTHHVVIHRDGLGVEVSTVVTPGIAVCDLVKRAAGRAVVRRVKAHHAPSVIPARSAMTSSRMRSRFGVEIRTVGGWSAVRTASTLAPL